jgi:hypothetical protein
VCFPFPALAMGIMTKNERITVIAFFMFSLACCGFFFKTPANYLTKV